jgi:hypothetical protein
MLTSDSQTSQWSALGEDLGAEDSSQKRHEIMTSLDLLGKQANAELRSVSCESPDKLKYLLEAITHAKKITESVLKPVDLSTL